MPPLGSPQGLLLLSFLLLTLLGCFLHSILYLWASLLEDEDHFSFQFATYRKPITEPGPEQRISTFLLIDKPRCIDA